jgi:hypothetical protein
MKIDDAIGRALVIWTVQPPEDNKHGADRCLGY